MERVCCSVWCNYKKAGKASTVCEKRGKGERKEEAMERNIDMAEVSDGRLYGLQDMVKAGCEDCVGCSACCHGMGASIVLDPCDTYRLTVGLGKRFEELLAEKLELHVVDSLILPNLSMCGAEESCGFLDEKGRCSIHAYRPGICRLFPLGRIYANHGFQYFLQVKECRKENRTKVKVKKWIDTPQVKQYEAFITEWHYFLKDLEQKIKQAQDAELEKTINLYVLQSFFMTPYEAERDFYEQFAERMARAKTELGV